MSILLVALILQHDGHTVYAGNLKGNPVDISMATDFGNPYFSTTSWETVASDTSTALRREIENSATVYDKMSASHAARNLLVSIVLLIGVLIAGSFTIRQSVDPGKPYRQCPFVAYLPGMETSVPVSLKSKYEGDGIEEGKSLAEAEIDWDTIVLSNKYACVFDPSELPIKSLFFAPPPSFKSKDEVDYVFTPPAANKQYISISE